jgi:phosphatidylglycerol---prolipoprotein diacylglyceryl transferase
MQGQLFSLLGQGMPSYFVLLMTGFLFATLVGALWARRVGQDPDVIVDLGLAMVIFGVAGARLLHVFVDGYFWDYVHLCTDPTLVDLRLSRIECESPVYDGIFSETLGYCHPREADCLAWAKFWAGGLTYYGGFLGATAAGFVLLRRDRFPFWKGADMAGMVVPLGLAYGRMGCFLAGCCFGTSSTLPWSVIFPSNSPASDWQEKHGLLESKYLASLPVHPTQLYESVGALAICGFLTLWLHGRKRYDGQVFVAFVALYAVLRFVIEFWRSDDRGGLFGLSTSQLFGIALVVVAILAHRHLLRRRGAGIPEATLAPRGSAR